MQDPDDEFQTSAPSDPVRDPDDEFQTSAPADPVQDPDDEFQTLAPADPVQDPDDEFRTSAPADRVQDPDDEFQTSVPESAEAESYCNKAFLKSRSWNNFTVKELGPEELGVSSSCCNFHRQKEAVKKDYL